ncbi:hypothetical protein [Rhizobium sp. BK418]|uniref:hypothetical protein n=1 Tax=Rhizobium sp. BK418 TaxID=2512120 RepID=UPI0010EE645B|nr:hypothetical protein [Rhizobium sp. BK418]TCS05363.1 hypothetical protein EV281_1031046 [Rhizobium sp. BK418]
MAKLYNMQPVQGVVIVPDGTRMFNNRPVIGIRDVGDATLFVDNRPVLGVDVISDGATLYNGLPVLGAVRISDGRSLYGNAPVIAVKSSGEPVDPDRYMFFASRGSRMPSGYAVDTTSIGLTYFASRLKFGNAPYRTKAPRFHFTGFAMNEGFGPQETIVAGNDVVIDGVDLIVKGVTYLSDFSGTPGVTIASGAKGAFCDFPTFTGELDPLEDFLVITRWHIASVGQKFIGPARIQKHRGEKYWAAADASTLAALIAADAPTTAVLDNFYAVAPGNQTNSQLICYGPDLMLAKGGWDGRPVVLGTGDSIGYGRQEVSASADLRGNLGWESKWLDLDGGPGRIPHLFIGCPSAQSARELATSALLRWDILDDIKAFNGGKYPFTIVINQMGTNDANTTTATWKSRLVSLISRIKTRLGADMKVIQCTIPPQNGSTAAYSTAAAITVSAPVWTTGRASINDDIRTNNGFGHDGYLDIDQAWADYPANPDKFRAAVDIGQIGTLLSVTPGDGSTTHPTGTADFQAKIGDSLLIEYQSGLYANRVVIDVSANGNGTCFVTFANTYNTAFQANAKTYWAVSPEGIHPQPGYIDHWIVPRLAQADKGKLVG